MTEQNEGCVDTYTTCVTEQNVNDRTKSGVLGHMTAQPQNLISTSALKFGASTDRKCDLSLLLHLARWTRWAIIYIIYMLHCKTVSEWKGALVH